MVRTLGAAAAVAAFVGILLVDRPRADELVTIDFPGAVPTNVFGVNPEGDVVGRYLGADGRFHGFVEKNGVFTTVDFPGSVLTQVLGINSRGDLVGRYDSPDGKTHGFVKTGDTFTSIDIPATNRTPLPSCVSGKNTCRRPRANIPSRTAPCWKGTTGVGP